MTFLFHSGVFNALQKREKVTLDGNKNRIGTLLRSLKVDYILPKISNRKLTIFTTRFIDIPNSNLSRAVVLECDEKMLLVFIIAHDPEIDVVFSETCHELVVLFNTRK